MQHAHSSSDSCRVLKCTFVPASLDPCLPNVARALGWTLGAVLRRFYTAELVETISALHERGRASEPIADRLCAVLAKMIAISSTPGGMVDLGQSDPVSRLVCTDACGLRVRFVMAYEFVSGMCVKCSWACFEHILPPHWRATSGARPLLLGAKLGVANLTRAASPVPPP